MLKPQESPQGQAANDAAIQTMAATQAALREDIATLELFVTRLEQGLSTTAPPPVRSARLSWVMAGTAAASTTAFVLSVWALIVAMPG